MRSLIISTAQPIFLCDIIEKNEMGEVFRGYVGKHDIYWILVANPE
jgi:hypothetical protein